MTLHSIERTHQRTKLSKESSIRFLENAVIRGKNIDCFKGRERDYLSRKIHGNQYPLCYNGYCFIVSDNYNCITMYQLPDWFGKKRFYDGKTMIRNPKNYYKNQKESLYVYQ